MAINKSDFLLKNTDDHFIPNTNGRHRMDCSYKSFKKRQRGIEAVYAQPIKQGQ